MERLTSNNPLTESDAMSLPLTDLYTRLKEYEDIGLAPEEIKKKLRTLRHYEDRFGDRPAKRWDELCDAEEQGRLIVLPCKLWDTLYDAYTGDIRHHYVTEFSTRGKDIAIQVNDFYAVGGCYCHASDIGKTVFLSREEAEKALEGMK